MLRLATQRGCAYAGESIVQEKSLPNVDDVTLLVVSAYSCVFVPSRERLLWYVATPARSVTPTVTEALLVLSVTLVAVRV